MKTDIRQSTDAKSTSSTSRLAPLLSVFLLLLPLFSRGAAPAPPPHVEGELLVKFKGGPRGDAAAKAQQALQHRVKRNFDPVGWQHIQLPPGQTVVEAMERFRRNPDVLAVEPNYVLQVMPMCTGAGLIPNDPRFSQQWGLTNICVTNAWATTTGSSDVVIAVIDSGMIYSHEDLAANMWRNPGESGGGRESNGLDDDGNGYVDDVFGIDVVARDSDPMDGMWSAFYHGTICAGVIGATGHNSLGIAGVNWSVQLMALRFLSQSGSVTSDMFVETCAYVVNMKARGVNVRATSNSYGFGTNDPGNAVRDAIDSLGQAGILNVFAAGVERLDLDGPVKVFPQSYHLPNMINVAASDKNSNLLTNESNWGATTVDLAAPGVNILTTDGPPPGNYAEHSGTSMSCPFVAGAVGLLAAAHPLANAGQIKTALMLSVDVVDNLTNKVASKGRLNVARAIGHAGLATNAPPVVAIQPRGRTIGLGDSVTFEVAATGPSSSPLTFQWRHNGADIADSTNSSLALSSAVTDDSGDYLVVVSNGFGSTTSVVASLTVAVCPVILRQPEDIRVADGREINLTVTAVGAPSLGFRWLRNDANIPNASEPTLTLPNVCTNDSGEYQVVVTNYCGGVTSAVSRVTVLGRPQIIAQSPSLTVTQGASVALCVTVTNTAALPIGARWVRSGVPSPRVAVMNQFTICTNLPNIQTNSAGSWTVILTNAATWISQSVASSPIHLTVVVPPTNQTLRSGSTASFSVSAYGPAPITYQWLFNGQSLSDGVTVTGATTARLILSNLRQSDAGLYTVVVTNAVGEPASFFARLFFEPMVRLVPCASLPSGWCLELCAPDTGCAWTVAWTDQLGGSNLWQYSQPWPPCPCPGSPVEPGWRCVRIPVVQDATKFFKLSCP